MSRSNGQLTDFGAPTFRDYFYDDATIIYRAKSGDAITIDAAVTAEQIAYTTGTNGDYVRYERRAHINASDVPNPLVNAEVEVGEKIYVLESVGPLVGGMWTINIVRSAQIEIVAPGYRSGN